jgi:hypothetical protein
MKYDTPEVTALTPAINAIQGSSDLNKVAIEGPDSFDEEGSGAYADWEE